LKETPIIYDDRIKASICCLTYNQVNYVQQMLESLLSQKTEFSFEILVHDDASNDGTREVIEKLTAEYPEVIMPLFRVENQYSKSIYQSMNGKFNIPRARGEFLFFCDGDDYWCDNDKLQRQIELIMTSGSDMVFHSFYEQSESKKYLRGPFGTKSREIKFWQIKSKGPNSAPLSTICIRKNCVTWLNTILPNFNEKYLEHSIFHAAGSMSSNAFYDPRPMSVYRTNVPGSWTFRIRRKKQLGIAFTEKIIEAYTKIGGIAPTRISFFIKLHLARLKIVLAVRKILIKCQKYVSKY
jgi:glycosyltransferase involved in cell wall biosynthesis